jgi:mannose-6-phosphate isomerase-like protein (cupin superfamily)
MIVGRQVYQTTRGHDRWTSRSEASTFPRTKVSSVTTTVVTREPAHRDTRARHRPSGENSIRRNVSPVHHAEFTIANPGVRLRAMAQNKKASKKTATVAKVAKIKPSKVTEVFTPRTMPKIEYPTSKGVYFATVLGKKRGDKIGLYYGEVEPGREIKLEIHDKTAETIYILSGKAVAIDKTSTKVPMKAGQILHIPTNNYHGLQNVGTGKLKILVIGSPDY